MNLGDLVIPSTARKSSHSASEMLGVNHPLSTPNFEANIVFTSSAIEGEDEIGESVALIQKSVDPAIPITRDSISVADHKWTRLHGIVRESTSGVVAQVVLITERNGKLYSITYSVDVIKQPGLLHFVDSHLKDLRWER